MNKKEKAAYMRRYYRRPVPKEKRQQYERNRKLKWREGAWDILGRHCVACGYEGTALQIDHVNGDGWTWRREGRPVYNHDTWREVIRTNGVGFQALCANCNWEKRVANNETGVGRWK